MSALEVGIYIFLLAAFLGYELVRRVPQLLHTPLMSLTNALSGIALVGSLALAGAHRTMLSTVLGTLAVVASTTNVVSGFMITDRMLRMFHARDRGGTSDRASSPGSRGAVGGGDGSR